MRDLGSCFSEHATQVISNSSCSAHSCISPILIPSSIQNAVTCFYRIFPVGKKQLSVAVRWSKNHMAQGLAIFFGDDASTSFKLNTNSGLFRKKRGSRSFEFDNFRVEIFWDLSEAKYKTGPEPTDGYYLLIMVDLDLGLILGDLAEEAVAKKLKNGTTQMAKFSMVSRQEHFSGSNFYSTKAQFSDTGSPHDILIRCSGEDEGLKKHHPVLSVSVDKKRVIRVQRLQWNFRGSQTIFVDGLLVDLMWDVHDWFFNPASTGYAVFMFRTRTGMDSRLWLGEEEEKTAKKDERVDFSLFIYACKTP